MMDGLLCDYLEHLWSAGEGKGLASDTLAALQDSSPKLRGAIPGAWRLLKTWHVNEIPCRAPPLPEKFFKVWLAIFCFIVIMAWPCHCCWVFTLCCGRVSGWEFGTAMSLLILSTGQLLFPLVSLREGSV